MKEKQALEVMIEFLDESRENLRRAEGDLVRLEEDPGNEELVNSVFRVFHSIKGSSGFLGLAAVAQLTHKLENILSAIKEKRKGVDDEGDLLLQGENLVDQFLQLAKSMKEADIDISRHPLMRSIAGNMDSILKEISVKKKTRRVSFDCVFQGRDFNPQARTIFECAEANLSEISPPGEGGVRGGWKADKAGDQGRRHLAG
ncbi:MAG: Hpt domain-containing protein [Nitrospinae bacterium]|nr:Hpt domain-containing protein [Nitrospinota bacterium]